MACPLQCGDTMNLFNCTHCGQLIYFENSYCEKCGYLLGFDPEKLQLFTLKFIEEGVFSVYGDANTKEYQYCANHDHGVCNWIVERNRSSPYCRACSLNRIIPNLGKKEFLERWNTIENAKHRLIYSLLRMKLPVVNKSEDMDKGLLFDFMADESSNSEQRILTGHANGVITLNIAEADDIEREMARKAMDEVYRTVLGHFRHEVGHYYWNLLIQNSDYLESYRNIFGDESEDYGEALKRHYKDGAPEGWNQHFISAYASSHPWEDWAETWAHYLHIIDTLETAYSFGLSVSPNVKVIPEILKTELNTDPYIIKDFGNILSMWLPITFAINSINRSMGLHDIYPFVIYPKVIEKLKFIHEVCLSSRLFAYS
jgi:hypothetical protein